MLQIMTIFFLTLFCTRLFFSVNFGSLNLLLKNVMQSILDSFTSFYNVFPHSFMSGKLSNISFLPNEFKLLFSPCAFISLSWKLIETQFVKIFVWKRCDAFVLWFLNIDFLILSFLLKSDWIEKFLLRVFSKCCEFWQCYFFTLFCARHFFKQLWHFKFAFKDGPANCSGVSHKFF